MCIRDSIESVSLTLVTSTIGTPGYMAPEQYIGETFDHRVDLFAAGVLLYRMSVSYTHLDVYKRQAMYARQGWIKISAVPAPEVGKTEVLTEAMKLSGITGSVVFSVQGKDSQLFVESGAATVTELNAGNATAPVLLTSGCLLYTSIPGCNHDFFLSVWSTPNCTKLPAMQGYTLHPVRFACSFS